MNQIVLQCKLVTCLYRMGSIKYIAFCTVHSHSMQLSTVNHLACFSHRKLKYIYCSYWVPGCIAELFAHSKEHFHKLPWLQIGYSSEGLNIG